MYFNQARDSGVSSLFCTICCDMFPELPKIDTKSEIMLQFFKLRLAVKDNLEKEGRRIMFEIF